MWLVIEYTLVDAYCGFDERAICCDVQFPDCHWIGKGTCDDNECAEYVLEAIFLPFN